MKIYALIPARSGSQGLRDKNILDIDGHPLMAYSIAFGQALGIDQVIVSTDSPEYAKIARSYGATCPYLRGEHASSGTAMEEDILSDLAANLPQHGIEMPDIWLRLKPTNPFRKVASVRRGLDLMLSENPPDSVRIVNQTDARVCTINSDGYLEPLTDHWDRTRSVMRRTEFPDVYSPYNLDILFNKNWERWGSAYMGNRIHPVIDHAITGLDINGPDDFEIIKSMIEARPRPQVISDYLVQPKAPREHAA